MTLEANTEDYRFHSKLMIDSCMQSGPEKWLVDHIGLHSSRRFEMSTERRISEANGEFENELECRLKLNVCLILLTVSWDVRFLWDWCAVDGFLLGSLLMVWPAGAYIDSLRHCGWIPFCERDSITISSIWSFINAHQGLLWVRIPTRPINNWPQPLNPLQVLDELLHLPRDILENIPL